MSELFEPFIESIGSKTLKNGLCEWVIESFTQSIKKKNWIIQEEFTITELVLLLVLKWRFWIGESF